MTIEQDDQHIYDDVSTAFAAVHAVGGPEAAIARGRALRRRRRTMPALAAAGVVAVSLGLSLTTAAHPATRPTASGTTKPSAVPVNVDDAAFSVHTDAKTGLVTVTVRELQDQDKLKQILAQAGVSSVFHSDTFTPVVGKPFKPFCTWTGAKALRSSKVITKQAPVVMVISTITIDPAAMPAGSVLAFDYVTIKDTGPTSTRVVATGPEVLYTLLSGQPTGCN